jgi:serine/threonine protein phosphatase PrpC
MARLQVPLVTLSVCDGVASADSPYISTAACEHIGTPRVHSFFAILEPLSVHPESQELAPLILDRLEQELATRNSVTATAAVSASVEAVNEELHHYNQHRAHQDRLYYGLTCGITRGDDLYLAQVLPSQVLIAQDGELYAFPGLETWHWSRRSDSKVALEQPLGLHVEIEPDLYHTRIDMGDLIVLCSTSLARVIQREPQDIFLDGDAEAAIEHLRALADDYNVDNASSAAIAVTEMQQQPGKRADFAFLRRVSELAASLLPAETEDRLRNRGKSSERTLDPLAESVHTGQDSRPSVDADPYAADTISTKAGSQDFLDAQVSEWDEYEQDNEFLDGSVDRQWDPASYYDLEDNDEPEQNWDRAGEGKRTLTEILAGAILALSAAVVGVWQLAVNRDRAVDDPREEENTYGLPRLQRYDNSIQRPDFSGVRRRLPRAPISKLTGFVSIGLVIALAVGLFYSITTSRERERVEQFDSLIERAVVARQSAVQSNDPAGALSHLQASEARLAEAEELGLQPERIETERTAIADARDTSLGIERLGNIQVLGGIPPAPEGVSPNLFFGNGQLYIFTDALYMLDAEGTRLIRLIGTGDDVGGHSVGELVGAAWGHGSPIVMDGWNAYVYESTTASWNRHELGNFGQAYDGVAAISGYIGNLYVLTPETGQILRYHSDQFSALPDDWTGGESAEQLSAGVDMVIDGRIYVLTSSGEVLDFYRGALDKTFTIDATPEIEDAVALSYQTDRTHIYVADDHGRILRVTKDGQVVQQFMAAADAPQLDNIQQMAVEDALGSAYVLTDDALLRVRLPGPPR